MSNQQDGSSASNPSKNDDETLETSDAHAAMAETETDGIEAEAPEVAEPVVDLEVLLKEAGTRVDDKQEQILRAQAEIENLKRRHTQEIEKAHKYALDKFVAELLAVRDSLELGNAAAQDENTNITKLREGTELTLKMLANVMQQFGIEQHDPTGEPFNPELHQAMSMQATDEVAPNHVMAVVQKGYSLNGRLIRPAMVMVSQATS